MESTNSSGVGRPLGDHQSRREMVAHAAWQVLLTSGIEGLTLRAIARQAQCSTGVLLHYFVDKDELLNFAVDLSFERVKERLLVASETDDVGEALRAMARVALPFDEESVLQWSIWIAFLSSPRADPEVASQARTMAAGIVDHVAAVIARGQVRGEIDRAIPAADLAHRLVFFVDGLSVRARFDPDRYAASRVEEIIETELRSLLQRRAESS